MQELDTEVKGDPESFTATCAWLRESAANAQQAEDSFYRARGESESGWLGEAGNAARDTMFQGARMAGDTVRSLSRVCTAMEIHADDLRTVKAEMQRARDAAAEGPLQINGFKIQPPGPAPAAPAELPGNATPQQEKQHSAATRAQDAYTRKIKAYHAAAEIVAMAKKLETNSQNVIVRSVSGIVDPFKLSLSLTDVAAGLTGAITANSSKFKEIAKHATAMGKVADGLANNPNMSAAGRFQAATIAANHSTTKAMALADAFPGQIARGMEYLPDWARNTVTGTVIPQRTVVPTNPILKGSVKLGKSIPGIGVFLTGAGVYYDISGGKDPTQAVVSGGASLIGGAASGAVIGAAFGGPVGVVGGAIVGIGVGIAVDEGWNLFG